MKKKRKKRVKEVEVKKELDYIPLGKCKSCKRSVKDSDFKDDLEAYNKFASTGLCRRCQDKSEEIDENLLEMPLEEMMEEKQDDEQML